MPAMKTQIPAVRAALLAAEPAIHGALDYAELERHGISPTDIVDFSENSNPFGPSPAVRAAMAEVDPARYPDRDCLALRRALAEQLGCTMQNLVVGNGAAELIWLIGFACIQAGDPVLIVGPTFGEYARTVQLMGGRVIEWRAEEGANFQVDVAALSGELHRQRPRLCFLCNPNNPTGVVTPLSAIAAWAEAYPQTLFVIDEAYIDFVPEMPSAWALARPNILVIRSMTKAYALAGVRLGYALGSRALMAALAQVRIPWSVSSVAQAAGLAALQDAAHLRQTLQQLQHARAEFYAQLTAAGFAPQPSATHYALLRVAPQVESARAFRENLLRHGYLVRDCASFGLPAYVRIATRRPPENRQLITCMTARDLAVEP